MAVIQSYLVEETAELQALLMHGRIVKPKDVTSSSVLVERHLDKLTEQMAPVPDAESEEAMRAQAAAEALLGGPANAE